MSYREGDTFLRTLEPSPQLDGLADQLLIMQDSYETFANPQSGNIHGGSEELRDFRNNILAENTHAIAELLHDDPDRTVQLYRRNSLMALLAEAVLAVTMKNAHQIDDSETLSAQAALKARRAKRINRLIHQNMPDIKNLENEYINGTSTDVAIVDSESGKEIEPATPKRKLVFGFDNQITIDGDPIQLTAEQKAILITLFDLPEGLSKTHKELKKAAMDRLEEEQQERISINLRRELTNISNLLEVKGLQLSDLIIDSGTSTTPRYRRNPNVDIADLELLTRARELQDSLFDQLSQDSIVDSIMAAREFFGVKELSPRHEAVLKSVLNSMDETLRRIKKGLKVDESGLILEFELPKDMRHKRKAGKERRSVVPRDIIDYVNTIMTRKNLVENPRISANDLWAKIKEEFPDITLNLSQVMRAVMAERPDITRVGKKTTGTKTYYEIIARYL